ncbi:hypothetical protein D9757_014474 [Collybiopsis confluens]|uniref:Glutaminase A central domain-containing protein n=1 Tax=Collybiopsis confluens TaxID=2823264 RepID=A0A8H5CZP2_9AGAR|nr:hypothetical protein D9757_014383 [Collybiopsis confluens]KAF5362678.1 hypothetical protein D9757_014474 [Collybiopsis confluens]
MFETLAEIEILGLEESSNPFTSCEEYKQIAGIILVNTGNSPVDLTVHFTESSVLEVHPARSICHHSSSIHQTNPVEILYAALPSILYINASWAGYLLEPLLAYQSSPLYSPEFAAKDLGNRFPYAEGNNATAALDGIEDVGDMVIMVWAHARFSGDGGLLGRYILYIFELELLPTASDSLSADGLTSPNQTNLAIKGILAIRTMAEISTTVGELDDGQKYGSLAASLVSQWETLAGSSGHLTSTYEVTSSWGLMYNLYYDKPFGFGLVSDRQTTWYSNALSAAPAFGFAFDTNENTNEASVAKSHWTLLTAGTVTDNGTRNSLVSQVRGAIANSKSFTVFPTTYGTSDASVIGGAASLPKRTVSATSLGSGKKSSNNARAIAGGVVGGLAALALLSLGILFYRRHLRIGKGGVKHSDEKSPDFSMMFRPRKKHRTSNSVSQELMDGYRIKAYPSTPEFTTSPHVHIATGPTPTHQRPSPGGDITPYDITNRGGEREDGSGQQRPRMGPLPAKITSGARAPRSESSTRVGGRTPSVSETGLSAIAAELRGQVENLRREMDEMRMQTQYEPPPEYE